MLTISLLRQSPCDSYEKLTIILQRLPKMQKFPKSLLIVNRP